MKISTFKKKNCDNEIFLSPEMFVERFVECLPNYDLTYFIMKANLEAGVNRL